MACPPSPEATPPRAGRQPGERSFPPPAILASQGRGVVSPSGDPLSSPFSSSTLHPSFLTALPAFSSIQSASSQQRFLVLSLATQMSLPLLSLRVAVFFFLHSSQQFEAAHGQRHSHVHTLTHKYAYTHTHTETYIHTCMWKQMCSHIQP